MKNLLTISRVDAYYLLLAVDHYCAVNRNGRVTIVPTSTFSRWQEIRDDLDVYHEHPAEDEWDE